jgi:small-conductance mechanosensitive channel
MLSYAPYRRAWVAPAHRDERSGGDYVSRYYEEEWTMIESVEAVEQIQWFTPALKLISAILLGLIIEFVVLPWLARAAQRTNWPGDDLLIQALHGVVLLWSILTGFYLAWIDLLNQEVPFTTIVTVPVLEQFIWVIVMLSLTVIVARVASEWLNIYGGRGDIPSVSILKNIIRIIIASVSILIILEYLNISVTPALAALGVTGLALSLALQETLSNLFSGILLVASNQIRPGNYVRLGSGEEGYVTDINWRTTKIRQLMNNMVIVPNAVMTSAIVLNYDEPEQELSILFDVGVSYDSDLDHVERVTIEVAREIMEEIEGGVPDVDPFIRYNQFAAYSINFTVIMRGKEFVNQYLIKHEFVKRLHRRYREEGIVIPFPIQTLHSLDSRGLEVRYTGHSNGHSDRPSSGTADGGGDLHATP